MTMVITAQHNGIWRMRSIFAERYGHSGRRAHPFISGELVGFAFYFAGYSRSSSSPFFGDRWQMKLMDSLQIHYYTKSKEGKFLDNKTATRNSVEK
jgi:hypothetical protein